jgi:lipopolysaccharide exporter
MTETFLVEMRKAAGEVNKFSKVASASLLLTLLIAMPISAFLISFHENITNLLLGANWVKYSELLAAFGTLIPASAIHRHCCRVLIIYNKPKHILFYEIVTFLIIYSVLFIIGINDLYFFTYVRVGLEQVLSAFFLVYISCKYSNIITTGKLFLGIVIILLSCCVAISATQFVPVVSNYELINLSVFFFCFTMVFFVCFMLFFFTILQNFSEWNYISSLMNRLLTTFLHWVRDN